MKNLKTVIAATLAAITIIGFSAFKLTKPEKTNDLYWFNVNATTGAFESYAGTNSADLDGGCVMPTPTEELCGTGLTITQIDAPPSSSHIPSPLPGVVPDDGQDKRYIDD